MTSSVEISLQQSQWQTETNLERLDNSEIHKNERSSSDSRSSNSSSGSSSRSSLALSVAMTEKWQLTTLTTAITTTTTHTTCHYQHIITTIIIIIIIMSSSVAAAAAVQQDKWVQYDDTVQCIVTHVSTDNFTSCSCYNTRTHFQCLICQKSTGGRRELRCWRRQGKRGLERG